MKINSLNVKITTEEYPFYFNQTFSDGVNIITSDLNTSGKSSIISAIMYCLGMEEIIGGRGSKVLSAAFHNKIKDSNEKVIDVLKADIYLEVSNGNEIVTIWRTANDDKRKDNLMTVFYGKYKDISKGSIKHTEMFVHNANSAKGELGFFHFLEKFIGLNLPDVLGYDGKEVKLYIQNIFAALIIEQKRGWSDILSRVPNYGIKDPKKKTIEYILNMDSLELSKKKVKINTQIKQLESDWKELFIESNIYFKNLDFKIIGITKEIQNTNIDKVAVQSNEESLELENLLINLSSELKIIVENKYTKNYENPSLNNELREIMEDISNFKQESEKLISQRNNETLEMSNLQEGLENLRNDIQNNKDINTILELGAKRDSKIYSEICPVCNQEIEDTLIESQMNSKIMSPEENISHLKSQEILFESIIGQKESVIKGIDLELNSIFEKIKKLNILAVSIKRDLYNLNGEYNENVIIKKLMIEQKIVKVKEAQAKLLEIRKKFRLITEKYTEKCNSIKEIRDDIFTRRDYVKIKSLQEKFINNLNLFGYRSIEPEENITISNKTLLPEIKGYDLKFDSSASDHIRGIWAYTIALQEVSLEYGGNHPNFLVFDEPNQHSIVEKDMRAFLKKITSMNNEVQTIIGFTLKDEDSSNLIKKLEPPTRIIKIDQLAFIQLDNV